MADKSTWRNASPDGDPVIQCTGHYTAVDGDIICDSNASLALL